MEGETQEARDNSEKICAQNIPDELVFDILTRLPVKSVLRFKCICKSWLSMISDPKFIRTHLHLSTERLLLRTERYPLSPLSFASIDFESPNQDSKSLDLPWDNSSDAFIRTLCSCDGLILSSVHERVVDGPKPGKSFALWNPSNRSHRRISCPYMLPSNSLYAHGLCYDSTADDYRVFIAFRGKNKTLVAVYSLRNNSWNRFTDNCYSFRVSDYQAVVNGAVHWVMYSTKSSLPVIVYFDLAEGKFKEVPPPPCFWNEFDEIKLVVLGGFLCVYCDGCVKQTEVYVMKEYAKKESWTRLFVMPCAIIGRRDSFIHVKLLCLTKKGQVLISTGERGIGIYDPKDGTFLRYDSIRGNIPIAYVESLISLNGEA